MFDDPADKGLHLFFAVIEPGNDKRHGLNVHAEFPGKGCGIEYRLKAGSADLFVKIIRESLDVNPEMHRAWVKVHAALLL